MAYRCHRLHGDDAPVVSALAHGPVVSALAHGDRAVQARPRESVMSRLPGRVKCLSNNAASLGASGAIA